MYLLDMYALVISDQFLFELGADGFAHIGNFSARGLFSPNRAHRQSQRS